MGGGGVRPSWSKAIFFNPSLRGFSGAGVSNSQIPKCYTFLESGGLAELISEEKIKIFLHNKILVLQILLYSIVNFRCRWKGFLKRKLVHL